jgi:two-component system sensor histidine kinase/response regulator
MLSRVHTLVRDAATAKGLTFHIDALGVPQRLRGDPARLAPILVNYLGNAVKFTAQGGIHLNVKVVEESATGCLLTFEVEDTGSGLSAESVAQLFSAFERGSSGDPPRGAGLGLAINARLAQLMGGKVGVKSEPGRGSTFWLIVQLGKLAASVTGTVTATTRGANAGLSAEAAIERDHRGRRVLLAEDDPLNQEVALELLRELGLQPVLAKDGLEAVRLTESNDFAVVLMDVQMPALNGLQATAAIRKLPGHAQLPIVAMTANAFREDRERCLAAGMNDFIAKPIDMDELCKTLLRWLTV